MRRADARFDFRPLVALLAVALGVLAGPSLPRAATQVKNPHGAFHERCNLCHDARGWNHVAVGAAFDHARTGFALAGAHASAACMSCHTSLDFGRTRAACAGCHSDPHRGEMGTECARCHGARSFIDRAPMARAHVETRFPLTGAHASVDCESCHRPAAQGRLQYAGTPTACAGCHLPDYRAAKAPDHEAGRFPTACESCHTMSGWTTSAFDHQASRFPLTGAHRAVACDRCHTGGRYTALATDCFSCHASTYATATPAHTPASFPTAACANCHSTTAWNTTFDHNAATTFPLTGAHTAAACAQCHGDGVYAGKSKDCYGCHQPAYASAQPPHTANAFPTAQCANCHGTVAWSGGLFDHAAYTSFPLTGAHVAATCAQCHGDGVYAAKSKDCYSCHAANYAAAQPPHDTVNYPTTGCVCHNTTAWAGASAFDHSAGGFPLTGLHAAPPRACADCHASGYVATSTDCISCHAATYAAAAPAHTTTFFPSATSSCVSCHATANSGHTTWAGGTYANHTWFPIASGRHTGIACMSCHTSNADISLYSCAKSCHTSQLASHRAVSGFSLSTVETMCYSCHPTGRAG